MMFYILTTTEIYNLIVTSKYPTNFENYHLDNLTNRKRVSFVTFIINQKDAIFSPVIKKSYYTYRNILSNFIFISLLTLLIKLIDKVIYKN